MSPPTNLPDGTEVSEIVLPDGASASEVIAPDGSTVFSAIPDSVVDNYNSKSAEPKGPYDSGTTLSDFYTASDMSVFERDTTNPMDGDGSLRITNDANSVQYIWSTPGDGLPIYPDDGDNLNALIQDGAESGDTDLPNFLFNVEDHGSNPRSFGFELNAQLDRVSLYEFDRDNDSYADFGTQLDIVGSVSFSYDTIYYLEIDPRSSNNDNVSATISETNADLSKGSELATLSADVSTSNVSASNRGVGFAVRTTKVQNSDRPNIDRIRIE